MKVEEIKCTGISYNSPVNPMKPTIQTMVKLFRMRFSEQEIFEMFPLGDYYSGSRFNDDVRVTNSIASGLVQSALEKHFKKNIFSEITPEDSLMLEGILKAFVDSLSASEMDVLILEGLRNCAETDYWYKFEKEWD